MYLLIPNVTYVFSWGCQFQATENVTKTQNTTLKTYGLKVIFIHFSYIYQHLRSQVQNSVFYEAFVLISKIQLSVGVTKYSKCMGSHVVHNITIPRTVWMVPQCWRSTVYCFSPKPLDKVLYPSQYCLGGMSL